MPLPYSHLKLTSIRYFSVIVSICLRSYKGKYIETITEK